MLASSRSTHPLRRGLAYVAIAAIALTGLADRLFYSPFFGWTAGLFTAALLLAMLLRPTAPKWRLAKWVASLALAGLCLALIEEPTPLVLWITIFAIFITAMTVRHGFPASVGQWLSRLAKFVFLGWLRIFSDAILTTRWSRRRPAAGMGGPAAVAWAGAKWIIPLLLGGVFIGLFALANPVVEEGVTRAFDHISRWMLAFPELLNPARVFLWIGVFISVWSLLRVPAHWIRQSSRSTLSSRAYSPRPGLAPMPRPADHVPPPLPPLRTIIPVDRHAFVTRCLIVFNIIFAVESALDVAYLWGGRHLPRGMNFKEYAHRGAYPLIATALLAAAFVLIAFRRNCNGESWRTARLLVYAWIAQNVLLTFSAGWRLMLLVNASNLTRWRLSTTIWLGLVAIGLLTIVWRIVSHRDNAWLLRVNIAMTAVVLYACCFMNLDGFIANYNADRCLDVVRNGDVLGLTYLRDIGIESIPALDRLSHTLDTADRRAMAGDFADELRGQVADDLRNWRGWTWRRWRLRPDPTLFHPGPASSVARQHGGWTRHDAINRRGRTIVPDVAYNGRGGRVGSR